MWTDMSEIVRPTRDGISRPRIHQHLGRPRPKTALPFFDGKKSAGSPSPLVSLPMPMIIDMASPAHTLPRLEAILAQTAVNTGLIAIFDSRQWQGPDDQLNHIAFFHCRRPGNSERGRQKDPAGGNTRRPRGDTTHPRDQALASGHRRGDTGQPDSQGIDRAVRLSESAEVEVIHIVADANGNEIGTTKPRFIKDMTRRIHTALIETGNAMR